MKKVVAAVLALAMFSSMSYSSDLMLERFSSFEEEVYKTNDTQEYSSIIDRSLGGSELKSMVIKAAKVGTIFLAAAFTACLGINFYKFRKIKQQNIKDHTFIRNYGAYKKEIAYAKQAIYGVPAKISNGLDQYWICSTFQQMFRRFKSRGMTVQQVDAFIANS